MRVRVPIQTLDSGPIQGLGNVRLVSLTELRGASLTSWLYIPVTNMTSSAAIVVPAVTKHTATYGHSFPTPRWSFSNCWSKQIDLFTWLG